MNRIFFLFGLLFTSVSAQEFQLIPKAELHIHLGGAYPKEYLLSHADAQQKQDLEEALNSVAQRVDYHDVFRVFRIIGQIVDSEERVKEGTIALCKSLQEDGVTYVEIRSGLKNLKSGFEAYLQAIIDGINEQNSDEFQARLILSLQRNSSIKSAQETIDLAIKYKDLGVVGIDISGDSTIGEVDLILPELIRGKDAGLKYVVHVGESPKEVDQMKLLTALAPQRVGHGVYLTPEAREWILSKRIPLEVCLTSSVLVEMIEKSEQHPGFTFFRNGHPIVFCTDDPLLFSTTLSKELEIAHQSGLSIEEIKTIAEHSFFYKLAP